jgi:zinc protease
MQIPEVQSTSFELTNGLTLIVAERHSAPLASVQAWCQTGSIHEREWLGAGLTHLLEHLLFNGTERRTSKQISDEIHAVGGYLNAYTSFDRTVFWADCPANAVRQAIDILGDMLFCSVLDPETLGREMEIVHREFDMCLDDPDRVLNYLTFRTAFQVHPCRYPVIGIREIFDQLTPDDISRYYRRRYVPNNIFLVVAGDVETDRVRADAEELLSFAKRAALEPVILPDEPRQLGRRAVEETFKSDLAYFNLSWHAPAVSHEDMASLDAASVVLGGGTSSRLYQELREKEGLVYGIGVHAYTPGFPGLLTVSGTCAKEASDLVSDRVIRCINGRHERRINEEEVQKAKRVLAVNAVEQLQTVKGVASDLGLNWLYARNLAFSRDYLERVHSVTAHDVERVITRYMTDSNLTVAMLRPEIGSRRVPPVTQSSSNPQLHRLSNGAKAVLIPDRRLPMVYSSVVVQGGALFETLGNNGVHRLLSQTMPKGTHSRSAEQIAQEIEQIGGVLSMESGYNTVRGAVSSLSADFRDAFAVLMDVAIDPVFHIEPTERERENQIAAIRSENVQPHVVARNLLRSEIYGSHPYALNPLGREASVLKITRAQLVEKHQGCFVWSRATFGFCGNFEANQVIDTVEKAMASAPSGYPEQPRVVPAVGDLNNRVVYSREGRHQAVVYIGFLACALMDPDRVGLELLDEATGDSSSRFFVKIREELGLAYSVGSSLFIGLAPGVFSFYAATSQENAEDVAEIIRHELAKLVEHGLEEDEFARAKARSIAQLEFQLQNMETYAQSSALNEHYGLGYDYVRRRKRLIEELSRDAVNDLARKYLMDKPAITVIVTP